MSGKRIILTGGGSAGHVTPNIALIPHLQKDGWEVHYIGTEDGIERRLLKDVKGVSYHIVPSGKLRRYFDVKNFTDPFKVVAGIGKAFALVGKIKPDVVFSKGGFVSVPVVYGAFLHHVPVVLHESDITPGLSNKITAPIAKAVCTTFPEAAKLIGSKGVLTGTPIRENLLNGRRDKGLALAGFNGKKPILLMMGGSLGAASVNVALRESLPKLLPTFDVIHICGKGNVDASYANKAGYKQFEYLGDELPDVYAATDVMLSRSGANALSEILALRKPALLVPYPKTASRGDQILNAQSFSERGLAVVLNQEDMNAQTLVDGLMNVYNNREAIKGRMSLEANLNGIKAVLDQITKYGGAVKA